MGLNRCLHKTKAEKVAEKAEYDRQYRAKNLDLLKTKKRDYHQRSYDPVKAAKARKKRMHLHVEYCRRPEYRAYKQAYDKQHRAAKVYGDFADAFLTLITVEREIENRATRYDIRQMNGTINKTQIRRRHAAAHR